MSVKQNLKTSTRYHELNLENMDEIHTSDFKGESGGSDHSWDLKSHKEYWSKPNTVEDVIHEQFGDGNKVCTRFTRKGTFEGMFDGKHVEADMLQIKTFSGGKISHIWEFHDSKQIEKQLEGKD